MPTRRSVLATLAAGMGSAMLPLRSLAESGQHPLAMPPLLDATGSGRFDLTARQGRVNFLGRSETSTWGFNQPYLGPTIRVATDSAVQARVQNGVDEAISVHWHGLLIPGDVDGGPHQPIAPGDTWAPELSITQPAATVWYHSHVHEKTAPQVQRGLAGAMQLSDGRDDQRGLPSIYGEDDLMLVLQDRRFDRRGRMNYNPGMQDRMTGFLGDAMVVNGQVGATAIVPKGIARLRLLNGSNARIYTLAFSDGRPMHLIAGDSGYLDRAIPLQTLSIAPGERHEVLVDFSDGANVSLMSGQSVNTPMMGGGMMGGGRASGPPYEVLPFAVDPDIPARITAIPDDIGGTRPDLPAGQATRRSLTLDMQMGPGMMLGLGGNQFAINGRSFDMGRTDFTVPQGALERWTVSANMMMHPFHVHGVTFQVLSENGRAPRPQNTGWKDTMLVDGQADLLMRFDQPASAELPFMFHCHILEHEDGGMMGQFAVV